MFIEKITGTSLIEVLVSLFLLSLMAAASSELNLVSLREAKSEYYSSVAMQQIKNMLAVLSIPQAMDTASALERWNQQNQMVLPRGKGTVRGQHPHFVVSIYWGGEPIEDCTMNRIGVSGCLSLT
ncbi:MAG: hypothetical protein A3F43_04230, partial [Gammaproteobacteria bacterium RIFCSPHIGHO2_12_FULL_42_10]